MMANLILKEKQKLLQLLVHKLYNSSKCDQMRRCSGQARVLLRETASSEKSLLS